MLPEQVELDRLFDYNGRVEELALDDEFREHLIERSTYEKHIVTLTEVLEAHSIAPAYFINKSQGGAPIVLIGRTASERLLCVPVEPTGRFGVWRPRTAFEANTHHKARYEEDHHDQQT